MFEKYNSIGSFKDIMKSVKWMQKHNYGDPSNLTFDAKIKLHGTNAAIVVETDENGKNTVHSQKRTSMLDFQNGVDNFGFDSWVHRTVKPYYEEVDGYMIDEKYITYIYGEWAGNGV